MNYFVKHLTHPAQIPPKIARRLWNTYREFRWRQLGYDFHYPAEKVRLRIYRDTRLGSLLRERWFEADEMKFLESFLRPGDVFVDIGANIGLYALSAGRYVTSAGQVFAFEPCARTFRRLIRNVEDNGMSHVHCERVAISSETGEAVLTISLSGYEAWNSLAGQLAAGETTTEMVPTRTWDEFAREKRLEGRVAFMKIDVEGWEVHVLKGAWNTLSREDAPVLQVEFTADNALASGTTTEELFQTLLELGFEMYRFRSENNQLLRVTTAPQHGHCNLLAAKTPRQLLDRLQRHTGTIVDEPTSAVKSGAS